jgi:O-acetyl-ADP-ribose deacetylase
MRPGVAGKGGTATAIYPGGHGRDPTFPVRMDHRDYRDQVSLGARVVDITTLATDAIVNAANEQLAPGGGVCGAIHRAAGPELARACGLVAPCPTGEARLTPGFRLPAKFVIHAVGPVWRGGTAGEPVLLSAAYDSAMRLAAEHDLRSIAFPAISTGVYGYPVDLATRIAVTAVRAALESGSSVTEVVFACFSPDVLHEYRAAGIPT